jgi:hypothetical protein
MAVADKIRSTQAQKTFISKTAFRNVLRKAHGAVSAATVLKYVVTSTQILAWNGELSHPVLLSPCAKKGNVSIEDFRFRAS